MWSYYDDYMYIPVLDVHAAWYLRVIIAFLHTSTLQSILSTYIAFCFVLSDKIDRLLKACSCMPMTKEISRNFITSGANSPELCARSCKSNYKIGLLNVQGHECWKIYKKIFGGDFGKRRRLSQPNCIITFARWSRLHYVADLLTDIENKVIDQLIPIQS